MDIVDYGNYVDYGYFGPCGLCIQWTAGIMWIVGTLDHVDCVDYGYHLETFCPSSSDTVDIWGAAVACPS